MNTAFSPIANRHNPKAAYTKIHEWVLRFGSPTLLSSSCENPILLNYQTLAQSNCWVTISYNRLFNSFFLSASNGIARLTSWVPIDGFEYSLRKSSISAASARASSST